jgi:hypothetical protein
MVKIKENDDQSFQAKFSQELGECGIDFFADEWRFVINDISPADNDVVFSWPKLTKPLEEVKPQNQYGDVLRRVAACLIIGVDGLKYSPLTAKQKIIWLRRFCLNLVVHGFERLELLTTKKAQELFFISCADGAEGKHNGRSTVQDRMALVSQLFRLQPYLGDGLREEPFPKKFRRKNTALLKDSFPWEAPPEPVSIFLIKISMQFIEDYGTDLVKIRTKYAQEVERLKSSGVKSRKLIAKEAYSAISNEALLSADRHSELLDSYDLHNSFHLAILIKHLQTACFVVITFTCGPRVSEVRRAKSDSLRYEMGVAGELVPFYYAQRSKKRYSQFGRSNELSLSGDDLPWVLSPAAAKAFSVLERLSEPARAKCGIDNLWLTMTGRALWPINGLNNHTVASNCTLNGRLRSFANFIDLSRKTGWSGTLHTHMGRKNLARFIAKRDRSVLEDLAVQYSHTSAYSVDVNYSRPDSEFRRLIKEELNREMEAVASELVGLPPEKLYIASKEGGEDRPIAKFAGKIITAVDVKVMLARGTILVPCQWGVCMYRQETSACEGAKTEPNPINRSPETCFTCSNFISTPKHQLWWSDFKKDSELLLKQSNLPEQTRLILQSRLDSAIVILKAIGE